MIQESKPAEDGTVDRVVRRIRREAQKDLSTSVP